MAHADFVHLRVHSAYSLSEGALRINELARFCRDLAMPACAITDTGNMFGVLEFSQAMAEAGVQPIIGTQIVLCVDVDAGGEARDSQAAVAGRAAEPTAIVLLAQNDTGYGNLIRLSSKSFLANEPGSTPHVTLADLESLNEGLICLTGGASGPLGLLIQNGRAPAAGALLERLAAIFPSRLYMELQRHGLPVEAKTEGAFIDLAFAHDVPLVATNDCFFPDETMFEAHDALICVAAGAYVNQPDRRRLTPNHRFKTAAEMRALFEDLPEAVDNTLVIARRTAAMAPVRQPILPRFPTRDGRSEADELRAGAEDGLERRLADQVFEETMDQAAREAATKTYRERLGFELDVIIEMDFPGYFLIVADFIQWAKANGIPVGPGRGSGTGSVVAWALTITDLDPLRFGLLFERFLNPDRVSMPDFDIDFCQERRDEVIRYVQDKYGEDHVAQIITFGKLQARAALRDVGRVLQMPFKQVDRLCKLVPNNPANPVTLQQAIDGEPRLQEERRQDPGVDRMMATALALEGLYRHASTHAAGVVIGDRPLHELIPLYRDPRSEMPVTQFSMKYAELSGLVKFDFLGLKTLTMLDRARRLLALRNLTLDFAKLPLKDEATFAMLGRGESVGVFQLEGSGMRDVLRQLKPDNFEDIIALVALYRPGPMDNIPKFINTKHGKERPDNLHPWLQPILEETYGVIVYQEQVMEIAQVLAGYSLGEADLLRRAMGKKIKSEMAAQRERFINGAVEKGVPRDRATYIFELVDKFAGYGFNKSHAAAYALVAWQTAYVKANYPLEFFAASMTLELANTDKIGGFKQELQRLGITFLPPDVNRSAVEFTVELDEDGAPIGIRYALAAIKNVGREAMRALVAEREENGPFVDLFDFASRLDPSLLNKRQLENLVRAGALDSLAGNRAQVFAAIDTLLRYCSAEASDRGSGQASLFANGAGGDAERPALPELAPWSASELLEHEADALGFYLSAHPLDTHAEALRAKGVRTFKEFASALNGGTSAVMLSGIVQRRQERRSARGNPFAFVQLSDPSGDFEVTVFSEQLSQSRELLETGRLVVVTVEARTEGDQPRLTAQRIEDLEDFVTRSANGIKVFVDEPGPMDGVRAILQRTPHGRGRVCMVLRLAERREEIEIELAGRYQMSSAIRQSLKGVRGVVDVQEML